MRKAVILSVVVLIISLFGALYLYISNTNIAINDTIPSEITDAKEIAKIVKSNIDKRWKNNHYFLSKVSMQLDSNLQGSVEVWFEDSVPHILTAKIDTKSHKFNSIIKQVSDSKLQNGNLDFENWNVNSTKAINITKSSFSNNKEFKFDKVYIYTVNYYRGSRQVWNVVLLDSLNKKSYINIIDPYTGEVLGTDIKP